MRCPRILRTALGVQCSALPFRRRVHITALAQGKCRIVEGKMDSFTQSLVWHVSIALYG